MKSPDLEPILLIAPDAGYDWQAKTVRELSALLRPVILSGSVTYEDATRILRERTFGAAVFLGHGTRDGIVVQAAAPNAEPGSMSAQTLIPRDSLPTLMRLAGVRLVVLASCQSAEVGLWIAEHTGAMVIATVGELGARDAYETLLTFAQMLARGMSVQEAFASAQSSQAWRMFGGSKPANGDALALHVLRAVDMAVAPLRDQIHELERRMDARMDKMEERSGQMDARIAPREPTRYRAYLFGIWLMFTPTLLYLYEVRAMLEMSPATAAFLIVAGWSIGALVVSYGQGWIR